MIEFRRFYFSIFIAIVITSSTSLSQTNFLPKTIHYELDLRIDYDTEKIFCDCEITISNHTDQPIEQIPILLYRLLTVKSVTDENNRAIPYSQNVISVSGWEKLQVNFIEISLEKKLDPNERRTIKIEYEGYLLGYSETGWRYVKDHINKDFTIIRTDGFGYPIIGYPNDRDMMAIVKERYHYLLNVSVPNGLKLANGGKLVKKMKNGEMTTYTYQSIKPSWRLDMAISDYHLLEKNENSVFYFAEDSAGAENIMLALEKSVNTYSEWFGHLHNYQGFKIIELPEGYGSQADITSILMTADNFTPPYKTTGIYHEISHLWNVIPLDPQPCRVESEGLAQFLQFLLLKKLNNQVNAIEDAAEKYLKRIQTSFKKNPKYRTIPMKDYGIQGMTDYSYTLGMVVFAILYEMVGDNHFNKMIGTFYSKYDKTGATLDDFINICKKEAPIDLTLFLNDWLDTTKAIDDVIEGKTYKEFVHYYKTNK